MVDIPPIFLGRKAAITALLLAVMMVVVFAVVPFCAAFYAQREEISASLHKLAYYQAEIAERSSREAEFKSVIQRGSTSPSLFPGESASLAQAKLQGDVKDIVESNGGEVRSALIIPNAPAKMIDTVSVQYELSVPITRLKDLTYSIESHMPYLVVDHISIMAPLNWSNTDPKAPEPRLQVRWTVSGFRWAGGK